jgi:transcriptional regulator with XRE-family HTH domain
VSTKGTVRVLPVAVAAWRNERRWSQKELAIRASEAARRETGDVEARVSASTVAMIETGEREPSVDTLRWIADALGVVVGALAFVAEPEPVGA